MTFYRRDDLDRYLDMWGQLALCLVLDAIGMASYLMPGMGELADVAFAPVEALWIWFMLNGHPASATLFAGVGFLEEIAPFTDLYPGCTIAWLFKYQFRR